MIGDARGNEREIGISEQYIMLKDEIARMQRMDNLNVMRIAVDALVAITNDFQNTSEQLEMA